MTTLMPSFSVVQPNTVLGFSMESDKEMGLRVMALNQKGGGIELINLGFPDVLAGTSDQAINFAACNDDVITVGAYSDRSGIIGLNGREYKKFCDEDKVASWSSYGCTDQGIVKPDIVAPGVEIISSISSYDTTYFNADGTVSSYDSDGDRYPITNLVDITINGTSERHYWGGASGTSMSCPVVAGTVALMLQANPNLTAKDVRRILTETAITDVYTEAAGMQAGAGKLNALAAIKAAYAMSVTGIEEMPVTTYLKHEGITKRIIDGKLFIIKNGKAFTTDGIEATGIKI